MATESGRAVATESGGAVATESGGAATAGDETAATDRVVFTDETSWNLMRTRWQRLKCSV